MARFINPWVNFEDENGNPYAAGKVYFGDPNTDPINNPKAPFSDIGLTTAIATTQTLDIRGQFQTEIHLSGKYSVTLTDAVDNQIRTIPELGVSIDPGVKVFDNIAALKAATDLNVGDAVDTKGYFTNNDGGQARYLIVTGSTGTEDGGSYHDMAVGLQAELAFSPQLRAEVFGITYRDGDMKSRHDLLSSYALSVNSKVVVSGIIDLEDTVTIPGGSVFEFGGGVKHSINTNTTNPSDFSASTGYRLLAEVGRTIFTETDISSQIPTGGRVTDSGGGTHTLADLTSGFTAGVMLDGENITITGSPIIYAKNGTDFEGYNDDTTNTLSDDIDVGLYLHNVSRSKFEQFYVVGHYRIAGTLQLGVATGILNQTSERNSFNKLMTMGARGLCIRSEDEGLGFGNFGISQTVYISPEITDLDHPSAMRAKSLSATPFTEASKALEISGDKIRGVQFVNPTIQGRDDCLIHIHDAIDIQFVLPYLESKTARTVILGSFDVASGSLVVASPFDAVNGQETNNIQMTNMRKSSNVDLRPYWDDSVGGGSRFTSGLFDPRACNIDHYNTPLDTSGDYQLRPRAGKKVQILKDDGTESVDFFGSGNIEIGGNITRRDAGSDLKMSCQDGRSIILGSVTDDLITFVQSSGNGIVEVGKFYPRNDNTQSLGQGANRWSVVFAGTGTIDTSDEREKADLILSTAQEKACALEIKQNIKRFRFNDAVTKKGDDARLHFGVGAQTVKSIFESHGLDPDKYGLFCYDEWDEQEEDGVAIQPGDRYGIRYSELICFILAAL